LRSASRAIVNWSFPPAILAMISPWIYQGHIITVFNAKLNHRTARELPAENGTWQDTTLRSPKYLNKPD